MERDLLEKENTASDSNIPTIEEQQEKLYQMLSVIDEICRKHKIRYTLFAGTMLGAIRHQGFIPWDDDLDIIMLREEYERFLEAAKKELDPEQYFLQKEFSEHWPLFFSKLRLNNTAYLEKYHPKDLKTHQGMYVDIFPCDNASDHEFIRKLQFKASKVVIAKSLDKRGYETDSAAKKIFMLFCRILPQRPFVRLTQLKQKNDTKYVHSFLGGASKYQSSVFERRFFSDTKDQPFEGGQFPVSVFYDEILTILYGDYMRIPEEHERECKKHAILVDLHHSWEEYLHYRDDMVFDKFTRSIR